MERPLGGEVERPGAVHGRAAVGLDVSHVASAQSDEVVEAPSEGLIESDLVRTVGHPLVGSAQVLQQLGARRARISVHHDQVGVFDLGGERLADAAVVPVGPLHAALGERGVPEQIVQGGVGGEDRGGASRGASGPDGAAGFPPRPRDRR